MLKTAGRIALDDTTFLMLIRTFLWSAEQRHCGLVFQSYALWPHMTVWQNLLGLTTVYVTHDRTEALSLSDRIAIMNQGKLVQLDTPATALLFLARVQPLPAQHALPTWSSVQ